MKKCVVLLGLVFAFNLRAENYERMIVLGMVPIKDMYAQYEIKTNNYEKVILDCQSFINGVNFYNNKAVVREIKMVDYYDCENSFNFINESIQNKKPICMELANEENSLTLSNDLDSDCH